MIVASLQVINKLLQTKNYNFIKTNSLTADYFKGYEAEFNFIEEHYKQFGNIPDQLTFLQKFPTFDLVEVNETDDYLLDRLQEDYGYNKMSPVLRTFDAKLKEDSRVAYNYLLSELANMKPHTVCKGIDIIANAAERWEKYEARKTEPEAAVIKTGFKELDDVFGGWEYGDELVTIVARTNMGKCLVKGTKVLMSNGNYKNIEDIVVGDKVQSARKCNTVLTLHNGVSKGYKVIYTRGKRYSTEYIVSENHILSLLKDNKITDIMIEDFLNLTPQKKKHYSGIVVSDFCDYWRGCGRDFVEMDIEIIPLPKIEYYGFQCDGDSRFVLENGVLTHNSWLLLKFLTEAWKQNKRVGLYSGEMSHLKLGYRFDALFGHFSNKCLTQGGQVDGYQDYINNLTTVKSPFIIITQKEFGGRPTVQKIRNFVEENQIEILGIDQFSLMEDGRAKGNDPTRLRMAHVAEDLFLLSSEYKIPILGLAQANREAVKKEGEMDAPGIENIKECDDIAHNSSKCIGMKQSNFGLVLDVIKNREGKVGDKLLYSWDIDSGNFSYIPSGDDAVSTPVRQQIKQEASKQAQNALQFNPF